MKNAQVWRAGAQELGWVVWQKASPQSAGAGTERGCPGTYRGLQGPQRLVGWSDLVQAPPPAGPFQASV